MAGANDNTSPGSYAVSVSQSAQQAVDIGSSTWASLEATTLSQAETYTVTGGSATATYAAIGRGDRRRCRERDERGAGRRRHRRLGGGRRFRRRLPAPTGIGGVRVGGHVPGGGVRVRPAGTDLGGSTYTGTDVAGTINGLAAVGSGQFLSSFNSGDNSNGLVLQVTTPGITSATALGTVTYAPGFGQGLAHIASDPSLAPNGIIPVTIAGLQGTLAQVGSEISMQQQLVATQQAALTAEFTNMETTLSQLQSESSFLNQAFGGGSSSSSSSASSLSSYSSGSSSTSGS